ncbi:carbohydrate-binding module family 1 protein [Xylariaceae sp. FL0594]|nr:carbohydrate-binding module family 1 protein [Xylariaceae sp. FL0594]
MKPTLIAPLIAAAGVSASPAEIAERQSCPNIYIFGARETTVPSGYGTAGGLVDMVKAAYPGSQSSAIDYPACGGQSSCGGIPYDQSAQQGTTAVINAVNSLNQRCPNTQIVLIGYSQGGQIMDNALCGGAGATLTGNALAAVKVAIFMGDPHNVAGLPYNVGTCTAGGFAARPYGFKCSPYNPANIKSYCDSTDPYCCNGNDANSHQQYVVKYGSQALAFIKSKLSSGGSGGGTTTTITTSTTTSGSSGPTTSPGTGTGTGAQAGHWEQCGGLGWTGPTTCVSPWTCQAASIYYSQCL